MQPQDYLPSDQTNPSQPTQAVPARPSRPNNRKRWLIIGGSIALVLILGGTAFAIFASKPAKTTPQPAVSTTPKTEPASTPAQPNSTPVTYKSEKLGIEMTYRKDWKRSESSDKEELMLTSPNTTYKRKDGTETQGVFTLKFRHGLIPDAIAATVQKAIAVKDSEVIAYAAPTAQQRQYTTLSFGGDDANTFNFFIVSGGTAYKAGDPFGYGITMLGDVYLIAGGYGKDTSDSLVFDGLAKIGYDTAAYQQAVDIIKSLKVD